MKNRLSPKVLTLLISLICWFIPATSIFALITLPGFSSLLKFPFQNLSRGVDGGCMGQAPGFVFIDSSGNSTGRRPRLNIIAIDPDRGRTADTEPVGFFFRDFTRGNLSLNALLAKDLLDIMHELFLGPTSFGEKAFDLHISISSSLIFSQRVFLEIPRSSAAWPFLPLVFSSTLWMYSFSKTLVALARGFVPRILSQISRTGLA